MSKEDCDDGADEVLEDGERPVSDCSEDQSDDHQHGSSWTTRRCLSERENSGNNERTINRLTDESFQYLIFKCLSILILILKMILHKNAL